VGVSCRWRADGARNMEVSLITGDCSNVGITYTKLANFYNALLRSKEEEIYQNSQERLSLIVQR
jgi:hypothetical protein